MTGAFVEELVEDRANPLVALPLQCFEQPHRVPKLIGHDAMEAGRQDRLRRRHDGDAVPIHGCIELEGNDRWQDERAFETACTNHLQQIWEIERVIGGVHRSDAEPEFLCSAFGAGSDFRVVDILGESRRGIEIDQRHSDLASGRP